MPNVREILFAIFDEWELQFMNSFIVSPKKIELRNPFNHRVINH